MKKLLIALGIVLAILVAAVLAVPYFFNAESQRGILTSRLEASLGRQVKLGDIHLGLFPPALQVDNAEIAEALGFKGPAFSTAKALKVRVRLIPLLQGRLEVPSIDLEQPTIRLIKNAKGEWNFATLGTTGNTPASAGKEAPAAPAKATPFQIDEMNITDGSVVVTEEETQHSVNFDHIFLTVKNFSADRPFDWDVKLHPGGPEQAQISANGQGGPLSRTNLADSPAQGDAKFKDVDLAMLGAFTGQPGLAGQFNGNAKFSSDGKIAEASGDYEVQKLRLGPKTGVAQAPLRGRFTVKYDSTPPGRLAVQQFELGSGKAVSRTAGHLVFGKATTADLQTRVVSAPLSDIGHLLPVLGVTLPAGSSLSGGTLNGQLHVAGAFPQPHTDGNVELSDARLANYNIAGKLGTVVRLASGVDTGGADTVIQQFKATFSSDKGYTATKDLLLKIPGMDITGAGGFADAGPLDFRGTALLTNGTSMAGQLLQRVTGSSNTVPFQVTGTMEHPVFKPDVGKIVTQQLNQQAGQQQQNTPAGNLLKGLGGLFRKK